MCFDTGELKAIPKETIELAQQLQRIAKIVGENNPDGNGEITINLKVTGGKISRFLNFAGKLFLGNKKSGH